jgi:4'-phosphopantetheinyl transferase EntD
LSDERQLREEVLRSLFQPSVAVACEDLETFDDSCVSLDAAWLVGASAARRRELAGGRACAARALAALGWPDATVGRGAHGEPLWPSGAVGSIAHAAGTCLAVAGRAEEWLAVGVDVEPDRPQSPAFVNRICSAAEQAALRALPDGLEQLAPVVFSAKEASYKLQFPLTGDTGGWAKLEVLLGAGEFWARYHSAGWPLADSLLHGRWRRAFGLIWTGVAVRQPPR